MPCISAILPLFRVDFVQSLLLFFHVQELITLCRTALCSGFLCHSPHGTHSGRTFTTGHTTGEHSQRDTRQRALLPGHTTAGITPGTHDSGHYFRDTRQRALLPGHLSVRRAFRDTFGIPFGRFDPFGTPFGMFDTFWEA